jgi:hypothetical protein
MSWKKFIIGEKMPDKNDPLYRERYERDVSMGRKFAAKLRIDKAAAWLQRFAERDPKRFIAIVLTIIILVMTYNVNRILTAFDAGTAPRQSVIDRQEQAIKQKRHSNEDNQHT